MAITQNDPITASDVTAALNEKAESIHTHVASDITDFPTIPTKTSDLTNDSGFLTNLPSHNHDDRYYTESEIDAKIPDISGKINRSGDTMSGTLNGNINGSGTSYRVWGAVAN